VELQVARAYAKKPRQGKATYPLVNQNPPVSTRKDNGEEPPPKKNRPHQEEEDDISVGSSNRDNSASVQGKKILTSP